MTRAAAVGLIVYALTVSLAGVDWLESLEPDFHSSIYGLLFLSFSMLNGLAFAIAGGLLSRRRIGSRKAYSALLLSMILVWAYLHAMQYLVIWSGNIPDEVTWYLKRSSHGWQVVLAALALGQFIFPFFALLIERIRGDRNWLLGLCASDAADALRRGRGARASAARSPSSRSDLPDARSRVVVCCGECVEDVRRGVFRQRWRRHPRWVASRRNRIKMNRPSTTIVNAPATDNMRPIAAV